jgi:pyruvate ferredoxin oxidoreductase gamma subunit/2-oxoisovalerate ferredoxin oxidoreductase gamma subunit
MIEVRIHGRGGQGAVIASQILAEAAFLEGMHVQAFPSFGSERRGAPVTAFLRLDRSPILVRSEVYRPDGVIVLDQGFISLNLVNVFAGLKPGGWILINTSKAPAEFPGLEAFSVATVDASGIARNHHLGTATAPIVNTVIVGAASELVGITNMDSLASAIRHSVPVKLEANVAAALEGVSAVHKIEQNCAGRYAHGCA